jgi:hypothetical protein
LILQHIYEKRLPSVYFPINYSSLFNPEAADGASAGAGQFGLLFDSIFHNVSASIAAVGIHRKAGGLFFAGNRA